MRLEDLDRRDDLMVNLEELKEKMDSYLKNVTRDELKKDLEKVGITVEDVSSHELDYCSSEIDLSEFIDKEFTFDSDLNNFSLTINDIDEEYEVELLAA